MQLSAENNLEIKSNNQKKMKPEGDMKAEDPNHAEAEAHAGNGHAPLGSAFVSSAAARLSACCHGGAKMAVLAYNLGKREINQYFSIKNAKLLAAVAVVLLTVFHSASRHYGSKCLCRGA